MAKRAQTTFVAASALRVFLVLVDLLLLLTKAIDSGEKSLAGTSHTTAFFSRIKHATITQNVLYTPNYPRGTPLCFQ